MTKQELVAELEKEFVQQPVFPVMNGWAVPYVNYRADVISAFLLKAFDAGVEAALKEAATVAGNTGDVSNNSMNIVRAIRKITL